MAKVTAFLIKKLRERTNAGIMDCKKALNEENGNIELAIENMRKSGVIKAEKKSGCMTSEGVVGVKIKGNCGVLLEVNCQTDFVIRDTVFQNFFNRILDTVIENKISDLRVLRTKFEEERIALILRIGENINIRRIAILESNDVLGVYRHGERIGVLVSIKNASEILAKQIAMHIAASKPRFVNPRDISPAIMQRERQIQLDIAIKSGKPKEIVEKIIEGRMNKFVNEISLTKQPFIMDLNKSVSQFLQEHNADVVNFVRFEVGEDVENN